MAPIASTSRIRRIVLIAGIFTMILGLGVAWLWRTAAGSGEQPDGPAQDSSWVDSGGGGSGADTAPGTTDDAPGAVDDDGGGPPVPRTAIEVAGPTLDNTNPDNTCSALISRNVDVPM